MVARRSLRPYDWFFYVILPGVFVALCLVMVVLGEDVPMAIFGIAFFGGGAAAVLLIKRRDARPLIVDETGIRNGRKAIDLRWDQVDGVYLRPAGSPSTHPRPAPRRWASSGERMRR